DGVENTVYRRRSGWGFPLCPAVYFQNLYRRPFRFRASIRSCHAYRSAKKRSVRRKCCYRCYCGGSFRACIASGSCKVYAEKMMKPEMITETPQKALLRFSLPLLAGSIFQNLYNVFDTMIVGQLLGKEALSAVGNSYVPMLITNSVLIGISSGISILVSQSYGAQEQTGTQECIGSVHAITAIVGIGLSILAFMSGRWIFGAMNIPENIEGAATKYWKMIATGLPFSAIYNFYSAIIKAKGNSKFPVQSVGISCMINIFLDLLFVGAFGLGIRGAAAA